MKHLKLKHIILTAIAFGFCSLSAAIPSAPSPQLDQCAKELLLSYFPDQFVTETLKKFNIPQEKWDAIKKALAEKDKEVIKLIEEKASKINPNPLKDPQQRQAAVKIYRETLLEVFSDAMKANGITDTKNYQAMLDDIQQQKAKKFAECMRKQAQETKNNSSKSNNDDDDDEDDDNDND